jgi:hypothetical protein
VVWCGVVWCGVVWCGVVWCGVVWCGVVWCGVVLLSGFHSDQRTPKYSAGIYIVCVVGLGDKGTVGGGWRRKG